MLTTVYMSFPWQNGWFCRYGCSSDGWNYVILFLENRRKVGEGSTMYCVGGKQPLQLNIDKAIRLIFLLHIANA